MSGLSLDGKSFFYENAQEIDLENREIVRASLHANRDIHFPITERVEVFSCSCCPPNVTRFIPSIGDFIYNFTDDTVYVNQYMASEADFGDYKITQETNYPFDGHVSVKCTAAKKLALRIPSWCSVWTLRKNGRPVNAEVVNGFAKVDSTAGDEITLDLVIAPKVVRADRRVRVDRGMKAVTYGPFVMCLEGVDNGGRLADVELTGKFTVGRDEELGLPSVYCDAVRVDTDSLYSDNIAEKPFRAKLIPYFAFANRGECDMRIWNIIR